MEFSSLWSGDSSTVYQRMVAGLRFRISRVTVSLPVSTEFLHRKFYVFIALSIMSNIAALLRGVVITVCSPNQKIESRVRISLLHKCTFVPVVDMLDVMYLCMVLYYNANFVRGCYYTRYNTLCI